MAVPYERDGTLLDPGIDASSQWCPPCLGSHSGLSRYSPVEEDGSGLVGVVSIDTWPAWTKNEETRSGSKNCDISGLTARRRFGGVIP